MIKPVILTFFMVLGWAISDAQPVRILPANDYQFIEGQDSIQFPFLGGLNQPRIQFTDLNNDSDYDLIILDGPSQTQIIYSVFSKQPLSEWSFNLSDQIRNWFLFRDIDNDGRDELITSDEQNQVIVYDPVMVTAASFYQFSLLPTSDGSPIIQESLSQPTLTDVDSDGDLDWLAGQSLGNMVLYENTGTSESPQYTFRTNRYGQILVLQDTVLTQAENKVSVLKTAHGASVVESFDYNSDGLPDLFFGDFFSPGIYVFDNLGPLSNPAFLYRTNQFPPENPVLTPGFNQLTFFTTESALHLFVTVNISTAQTDNFYHYRQLKSNPDSTYELLTKNYLSTLDVGRQSNIATGDLNGDGMSDLLIAGENGKIRYYVAEGETVFRLKSADLIPSLDRFNVAIAIGDIDNDSRADLLLGDFEGRLIAYQNLGFAGQAIFAERPNWAPTIDFGSYSTPFLYRIHSDSLLLVVGNSNGNVQFFTGRFPSTEAVPQWTSYEPFQSGDLFVVPSLFDFDRNGSIDLLLSSVDGQHELWTNIEWGNIPIQSNLRIRTPFRHLSPGYFKYGRLDSQVEIWAGNERGGLHRYEVEIRLEDFPPEKGRVMIRPNPTSDFVTIASNLKMENMKLFDSVGRLVLNQEIPSNKEYMFSTSHLASGRYFLIIRLIDGSIQQSGLTVLH